LFFAAAIGKTAVGLLQQAPGGAGCFGEDRKVAEPAETTPMKRALALSTLALAASAACAQSSVQIYGIVDAGVQRVTGYRQGTDTALVSGIMEGSRFGLRGNEDMGGGWRAIFTLENRTELNNGTLGNRPISGAQLPDRIADARLLIPALCPVATPSGPNGLPTCGIQAAVSGVNANLAAGGLGVNIRGGFWDRQAFVGLVTPFGGFLAGRQYTPGYEVTATFDVMGTQSSLAAGQVASFPSSVDIRVDNALQYRIVLGGLTASAMYAFGGVSGNNSASRLVGVNAIYRAGPFAVGLGHNQRNNELGQKSLKSTVAGASMDIGPGKLSGLYATITDDNPSGLSGIATSLTPLVGAAAAGAVQNAYIQAIRLDGKLAHIGYRLTSGVHTVYVAYSAYNDARPANADTASYGAAYTYALSKRTDLNAVYTHFDNKNLAQAAPGQAGFLGGVTKSAGTDANSLAVGVRHRF
jgi:predicted porin